MEDDPEERGAEGVDGTNAADLILEALIAFEEEGIIRAFDEIQG